MSRFNKMLYLSASVIILTQASETLANPDIGTLDPTLTSHSFELRPDHSFQLARATFLPDTKDDLGFSGRDTGGADINRGDPCKDYTLSQCPANGTCTPCPTNPNKKKLTGCDFGYKISGNTCVAATCSAIDSSYKSFIPSNSYCTKVSKNGLTCYKDCKNISCSGYNLSCLSGILSNTYVSNGITYQACPDCPILRALNSTTVYNCRTKCKISQCPDKQKLNDAGTACVDKDDNCPNGYYKSCETGIETTVTPKYTEAGTACYQCKAKTPPKRTCDCPSDDYVCLYSNDEYTTNHICIGPECSEETYPYNLGCVFKKGCVIAPVYGQWCPTQTCDEENGKNWLCESFWECNNKYESRICPTDVFSCKITGDYSTYECGPYEKCVVTDDGYYIAGECVPTANFDDAVLAVAKQKCYGFLNSGADAKVIAFYKDSSNSQVSTMHNKLSSLARNSSTSLTSSVTTDIRSTDNDTKLTCCNPHCDANCSSGYNQCKHSNMYHAEVDTYRSKVITNFCKMQYCGINVSELPDEMGANKVVLEKTFEKLLTDENPFRIYIIGADNKTISASNITNCRTTDNCRYIAQAYIGKAGACKESITYVYTFRTGRNVSSCSSRLYRDEYTLYYNPDTLKNYEDSQETSPFSDCYDRIGEGQSSCCYKNRDTTMYPCYY